MDAPPRLKEPLDVVYPEAEKRRGHQGIVVVNAAIDERGDVVYAVVTKRSRYPALDSAALRAVAGAWFKPAMRDGKPVTAQLGMPIEFAASPTDDLHDVEKTGEELREDIRALERSKQAVEEEQRRIEEEIKRLKRENPAKQRTPAR